jgi:hypothetical protein
MNPIILAELIAAKHGLHPNTVFFAPSPEHVAVRGEWIRACMRMGLLPNEIKEISGWNQMRFNDAFVFAVRESSLS